MPHQAYSHDGAVFPSVTEVLGWRPKPWLEKWRAKWGVLADRKTIAANQIGTAFHIGAEKLSRGELVDYPKNRRLGGMLERLDAWFGAFRFQPKETEYHVVSEKYQYHGTIDSVGFLQGRSTLVVVDYKSSSGIYEEMAEQLAAYAQAYYEMTGIRISDGLIVHVSKKKPKHLLTVKEYKLTKKLFNKFLQKLRDYQRDHA